MRDFVDKGVDMAAEAITEGFKLIIKVIVFLIVAVGVIAFLLGKYVF